MKSAGTLNEAGGVAKKAVLVDEELDAVTVGFGTGSACTSRHTARRAANTLTRNIAGRARRFEEETWVIGIYRPQHVCKYSKKMHPGTKGDDPLVRKWQYHLPGKAMPPMYTP